MLTRIWPVPDDLPHAAGMGNLARVKQLVRRVPARLRWAISTIIIPTTTRTRASHLQWDTPTAQQVLDTALAFAVINRHFDVADFLLEHGADINTNWNSHEPASILHHLVFLPNPYESMRFLIDRGIDMTIKDYRWDSNAAGLGAPRQRTTRRWPSGWRRRNGSGNRDDELRPRYAGAVGRDRPRRYSAGVKPVRRLNVVVSRLCVPKPHSTATSASE